MGYFYYMARNQLRPKLTDRERRSAVRARAQRLMRDLEAWFDKFTDEWIKRPPAERGDISNPNEELRPKVFTLVNNFRTLVIEMGEEGTMETVAAEKALKELESETERLKRFNTLPERNNLEKPRSGGLRPATLADLAKPSFSGHKPTVDDDEA